MRDNPKSFLKNLSDVVEVDLSGYGDALKQKKNVRKTVKGRITPSKSFDKPLYRLKLKLFGNEPWPLPSWFKELLKKPMPFSSKIIKDVEYTPKQKEQIFNIFKESNKKLDEEMNLNLKEYGYY